MKILALEFSSPRRSVAVLDGATVLAEQAEAAGQSVPPLRLIEKALAAAQVGRSEIECVAVGLGPGSYTGIRGAIALAQGWQLAASVKLLGIGSVECIAAQAQTEGILGNVGIVIDAQRGEYYFSKFEISDKKVKNTSNLTVVSLTELNNCIKTCDLMVGTEALNGAEIGRFIFPGASTLGRLAAVRNDFVSGEKLEPIYLRATSFVKASPARIFPAASA